MKLPDPEKMTRDQSLMLDRIYAVIAAGLTAHGLKARRAEERMYRDDIWENLCICMVGSKFSDFCAGGSRSKRIEP